MINIIRILTCIFSHYLVFWIRSWWMWALILTKRAVSSWRHEEGCTASTSMLLRPTIDKLFRYYYSVLTVVASIAKEQRAPYDHFASSVLGQPDGEWLADDISLCWRPGCDQRSCNQRRPGDHGEGGQGLPQTGARQPDGRLEVFHILRVPGLSLVKKAGEEQDSGRGYNL